jgi:hypothetical protein
MSDDIKDGIIVGLFLSLIALMSTGCVTRAKYARDVNKAMFVGMLISSEKCQERMSKEYRFLFGDRIEKATKKKPLPLYQDLK